MRRGDTARTMSPTVDEPEYELHTLDRGYRGPHLDPYGLVLQRTARRRRSNGMTTMRLRLLAPPLGVALALTACGGSAGSSGSSGSAASGSYGQSSRTERAPGAAHKAAAAQPTVLEAAIISTGTIALRAADVEGARARVQHVADRYAGQVAEEETTASTDTVVGRARVVLRVPADSFTSAMSDLAKVAYVVDSSTTSTDVSTRVIDVDERVKSARASLARIRTLLGRADKIGDVISIESELSEREADLNSLLAQQAHLADQTALSTITVSITQAAATTLHRRSHSGFVAGLEGGWHALRAVAAGVATVAGALLPWLPVVLVVGVPAWLLARRRRSVGPDDPAGA